MIVTYSRVRVSGRPYATPCHPSITCGPEGPSPRMNRPPERASSVIAVIAVMAGVRAGICMIAVPSLILLVLAAIQVSGVMASFPYASAVQTESYPSFSASRIKSMGTEGLGPNVPAMRPSRIGGLLGSGRGAPRRRSESISDLGSGLEAGGARLGSSPNGGRARIGAAHQPRIRGRVVLARDRICHSHRAKSPRRFKGGESWSSIGFAAA